MMDHTLLQKSQIYCSKNRLLCLWCFTEN